MLHLPQALLDLPHYFIKSIHVPQNVARDLALRHRWICCLSLKALHHVSRVLLHLSHVCLDCLHELLRECLSLLALLHYLGCFLEKSLPSPIQLCIYLFFHMQRVVMMSAITLINATAVAVLSISCNVIPLEVSALICWGSEGLYAIELTGCWRTVVVIGVW